MIRVKDSTIRFIKTNCMKFSDWNTSFTQQQQTIDSVSCFVELLKYIVCVDSSSTYLQMNFVIICLHTLTFVINWFGYSTKMFFLIHLTVVKDWISSKWELGSEFFLTHIFEVYPVYRNKSSCLQGITIFFWQRLCIVQLWIWKVWNPQTE